MNNSVVVDSNLLLLLIVGTASREYIAKHKKLAEYSDGDLDLLTLLISQFSDILLVPHVLTEVSSFSRNPRRKRVAHRRHRQADFRAVDELGAPEPMLDRRRIGFGEEQSREIEEPHPRGECAGLIARKQALANQCEGRSQRAPRQECRRRRPA